VNVPPSGNGGIKNNIMRAIPGGRDPRIPNLLGIAQGSLDTVARVSFTQQRDYLLNTVARYVGEARSMADLTDLTLGWADELFGIKSNYNFFSALVTKDKTGTLSIKGSKGNYDVSALGLDQQNSALAFALREKRTVYLPNVLAHTDQGDREFRYLEGTDCMAVPSSQTGVDLSRLIAAGTDKPCILIAPLLVGEDVAGALVMAVGMGVFFGREYSDDLVIAKELASQIGFGIRLLEKKGLPI